MDTNAWDCVRLTEDEKDAVLSALDGYEPDTASYDPEDPDPMGWSPKEIAALNRAYHEIARSVRRQTNG